MATTRVELIGLYTGATGLQQTASRVSAFNAQSFFVKTSGQGPKCPPILRAHPYEVSVEKPRNQLFAYAYLILTDSKEGLRQAPKINQPFIPDTAPVRRSHIHATISPQSTPTHDNVIPSANPNSAQFSTGSWDGQRLVPMSTREVATPGNRPGLFPSVSNRAKTAKQANFYDPYFPLRFIEVPKCK